VGCGSEGETDDDDAAALEDLCDDDQQGESFLEADFPCDEEREQDGAVQPDAQRDESMYGLDAPNPPCQKMEGQRNEGGAAKGVEGGRAHQMHDAVGLLAQQSMDGPRYGCP